MEKLYKNIEGKLHYHEAWSAPNSQGGVVMEHWGVVGEKGETKEHSLKKGADEEAAVAAVLRSAVENGFKPFDNDDLRIILVEYAVDGMGAVEDVDKRHALEDVLNECLGWTGLGHCDGGSIGSGTMEACCFVVDFDIAKRVIENELKDTEFGDYTRIYEEGA